MAKRIFGLTNKRGNDRRNDAIRWYRDTRRKPKAPRPESGSGCMGMCIPLRPAYTMALALLAAARRSAMRANSPLWMRASVSLAQRGQ